MVREPSKTVRTPIPDAEEQKKVEENIEDEKKDVKEKRIDLGSYIKTYEGTTIDILLNESIEFYKACLNEQISEKPIHEKSSEKIMSLALTTNFICHDEKEDSLFDVLHVERATDVPKEYLAAAMGIDESLFDSVPVADLIRSLPELNNINSVVLRGRIYPAAIAMHRNVMPWHRPLIGTAGNMHEKSGSEHFTFDLKNRAKEEKYANFPAMTIPTHWYLEAALASDYEGDVWEAVGSFESARRDIDTSLKLDFFKEPDEPGSINVGLLTGSKPISTGSIYTDDAVFEELFEIATEVYEPSVKDIVGGLVEEEKMLKLYGKLNVSNFFWPIVNMNLEGSYVTSDISKKMFRQIWGPKFEKFTDVKDPTRTIVKKTAEYNALDRKEESLPDNFLENYGKRAADIALGLEPEYRPLMAAIIKEAADKGVKVESDSRGDMVIPAVYFFQTASKYGMSQYAGKIMKDFEDLRHKYRRHDFKPERKKKPVLSNEYLDALLDDVDAVK